MAIRIEAVNEETKLDQPCQYELYSRESLVGRFFHIRIDGIAVLLTKAAKVAREYEDQLFNDMTKG